ncbi:unnamed protein product [Prorocentrum cordatum]|uniref:LNR domain-containing protein n=1 Tax=Prorocentrum cordatum TaxID=2364126 RepID=A0ABN9RS46_9DINO|nr:unnamed protein product [Polarella glacialis]
MCLIDNSLLQGICCQTCAAAMMECKDYNDVLGILEVGSDDCSEVAGWGWRPYFVEGSCCEACSGEATTCADGCYDGWPGDGTCDSACNNWECNYDGGYCDATPEQSQSQSLSPRCGGQRPTMSQVCAKMTMPPSLFFQQHDASGLTGCGDAAGMCFLDFELQGSCCQTRVAAMMECKDYNDVLGILEMGSDDCSEVAGWGWCPYFAEGLCCEACSEEATTCADGCYDGWLGDGMCDSACNNWECNYDRGDCDEEPPTDPEGLDCGQCTDADRGLRVQRIRRACFVRIRIRVCVRELLLQFLLRSQLAFFWLRLMVSCLGLQSYTHALSVGRDCGVAVRQCRCALFLSA